MSLGEWNQAVRQGRWQALHYPVTVTGVLLPLRPIQSFLDKSSINPFRRFLESIVGGLARTKSFDALQSWVGLHTYPKREGEGPYFVPFEGRRPGLRMGLTVMSTSHGDGFTISCAECHSANLFGRRVIGMSSRFPRANAFFVKGLHLAPLVPSRIFRWTTGANDGEMRLFERSKKAMRSVAARVPVQLGLDTSLAQVALSLAKRRQDAWASIEDHPSARFDPISHIPADSKPAVWWNIKYKDRWLSDGSVVSGNPIFTNFIWNEIGRGTDLHQLDSWLRNNATAVKTLTTAVFASEAPRWTDFFPARTIDEASARRGEKIFLQNCAHCHGIYKKAWDLPGAHAWTWARRMRTVEVRYPQPTRVVNVGTDPSRYLGMRSLVQLNNLEISKRNHIVIEAQHGYVPPPLVGIWARWPYFHNNSAPSLCAVLTASPLRPKHYWARPANDPDHDFDKVCNGYPSSMPRPWPGREYFYDTSRPGMHNTGHDEGIFLRNGKEILSGRDKMDLIAFLKTL